MQMEEAEARKKLLHPESSADDRARIWSLVQSRGGKEHKVSDGHVNQEPSHCQMATKADPLNWNQGHTDHNSITSEPSLREGSSLQLLVLHSCLAVTTHATASRNCEKCASLQKQ